jgi:uncharacterized protein
MNPWTYRNRWALVTGASAGLGAEFARALARHGMHLVLTARREDRLLALEDELRVKHRVQTHIVPLDLSEPGAAETLWTRAGEAGREIHLLVNNAGFGARGPFLDTPRERHVQMLHLNVTALLELTHLALSEMVARRDGGILNVSSVVAFQPLPTYATYAASKAYVQFLSEALWEESRHHGVRVSALCPGRTPTEFQQISGSTPVEKGGLGILRPEEVVETGLRALEKGKAFVVPGASNKLKTQTARLLPRQLLQRVLGRAIDRLS